MLAYTNTYDTIKYKIGSIIGLHEFMFELCWQNNIFGADSGYYLKLEKDLLVDIALQ